ncbi:MAG: NAD(P)/FAD-dependent oxidoreductase, partial [Deltaproteobacteria bacterium]|nr:NAD(P)/FAD-dependent oxidoreductase [Deltaproteobacteria bacterium]
LEKFERVAEGVTSRNSGVIHSGIYYPVDSLKARLCIRGKELLYAWCARHGVANSRVGKAIVATNAAEEEQLEALWENARRCGATGLERWPAARLREALAGVHGVAAVFASETGIVDPFEFTRSLLDDAEARGAMVLTSACVRAIRAEAGAFVVDSSRGKVRAARVFNAAGLFADEIARLAGIDKYRVYPCRGDYFRLRGCAAFRHLVYPVRAKGAAGLGIHLTLDLAGGMRLGPDSEYVTSKEDFSLSPEKEAQKREKFRATAEKLFGPIALSQLEYDQCGLRPKLRAPDEREEKDFVISEDLPGFVNLVGIESPGLTAAMAIAEYAVALASG